MGRGATDSISGISDAWHVERVCRMERRESASRVSRRRGRESARLDRLDLVRLVLVCRGRERATGMGEMDMLSSGG